MDIWSIGFIIYYAIGCILTIYWYKREYSKKYKEAEKNKNVEIGMMELFLLLLIFFWPIKVIKNLIIKKSI